MKRTVRIRIANTRRTQLLRTPNLNQPQLTQPVAGLPASVTRNIQQAIARAA